MKIFKITWRHVRGNHTTESVVGKSFEHVYLECLKMLQQDEKRDWRLSGIVEDHDVIVLQESDPSSSRV